MDSTVTADASTVTVDQYGNQVDQYGNKINKWVRKRDGGTRRHRAGDNQCHVGYSFPSYQRDTPGTWARNMTVTGNSGGLGNFPMCGRTTFTKR